MISILGYFSSKSPINQATSKAMLTQMISIVFRRMESDQVFPNLYKLVQMNLHWLNCVQSNHFSVVETCI